MKRIGILSDTHSYIDSTILGYFEACDEIWHAGDIGNSAIAATLAEFKPFRAVYGNIDDQLLRSSYPLVNRFFCEQADVMIKHIVGYPGKYEKQVREILKVNPPKLLIAGHSHILKVQYDTNYNLLYVNPGAAGKSGFHHVRTLVRLTIDKADIKDLEVVEFAHR
ncbi:MAG: metallophosphoesterase family protein [Bacteroidales bacterium]|nr:metallophosphoesterase family protein [Bacteroidales bacterium]